MLYREEWKWDSPLFCRVGKIRCKLNLLSLIDPISNMLRFPCKDIYKVEIEDVQIFVEKRRNVFNFHLLDSSLDIPDPSFIMESAITATNASITDDKESDSTQPKESQEIVRKDLEGGPELITDIWTTFYMLVGII